MGLTDCFECGTPISGSADRCPKCGTTDTPLKRWKQKELDLAVENQQPTEPFSWILYKFTIYFILTIAGTALSVVIIGPILWPLGICLSVSLVPVVIIGLLSDFFKGPGQKLKYENMFGHKKQD
jgi:ribosomal protein L40E